MSVTPVNNYSRNAITLAVVITLIFTSALFYTPSTTSLRLIESDVSNNTAYHRVGNLTSIGDLDNDGFMDLALLIPSNSSMETDGGTAHIFLGTDVGYPAISPENADVSFFGGEGFGLGTSIDVWDVDGNGWGEIVLGCPGADNGTGSVFMFDAVLVNGAPKGTFIGTSQAYVTLKGDNVSGFGSVIEVGYMTPDEFEDLVVLSALNDTHDPQLKIFMGGVLPDQGIQMTIPRLSVSELTTSTTMDLMGRGQEAFIYSTPDKGETRVIYFTVDETRANISGMNPSGIVDFQGLIEETGNTWGWGSGDDGWDTSPTHIYDASTGYDSVRYNQASGNARGYDRSVTNVNRLDIEIGGVLSSSDNRDQSGAYGTSVIITPGDLAGKNSVVLSFDYHWENYGFEDNERIWIKSKITDSTGTDHWLGSDRDGNPEPDGSPEIWTIRGSESGGSGITQSGTGYYETEIMDMMTGPGEYYLEFGGKVSRWTTATECGAFGFDNISLRFQTLTMDSKKITGQNGIGSSLFAGDVNGDGKQDLLMGNPKQDNVDVFFGNDSYWDTLGGINFDRRNASISGPSSSFFGASLMILGTSDFTPNHGLFVSSPGHGNGSITKFDLPLSAGDLVWDVDGFSYYSPPGVDLFGAHMVAIGDPYSSGYPGLIISSRSSENRLVIHEFDRSSNVPTLSLDSPNRSMPISGVVKVSATTTDLDGDVSPWDIEFFYSVDNRSWADIGNGTPDEVIGDQAVKYWNTSLLENRYFFLKVQVADTFGNLIERYSNSVEVLNHDKPTVILIYPTDGTLLKGREEVTARVIVTDNEEIEYPVTFFYSRDGLDWTEFGNASQPISGSDVDYSTLIDTELLPDGNIWFRVNASTVYGLGKEDVNSDPCTIDNAYPPVLEFIGNYSGLTRGNINFTLTATDRDDDLLQPIKLYYREVDTIPWDLMGNMTDLKLNDTFFFEWDTITVNNTVYQIKAVALDSTNKEVELLLNVTIDIHNFYTPTIEFVDIDEDSVFSGIPRLSARISDRDSNFNSTAVSFFYKDPDLEFWNRITPVLVTGMNAIADWDTQLLPNGDYDLRVEVIDRDGLIGSHEVLGISVKNVKAPIIDGELIPTIGDLSGVIKLRFNVSDDLVIPERNIKVEIFVFSVWVEITGLTKADPNQTFEPWKNIPYFIEWDTAALLPSGERQFPDGPVYEYKFSVTDSDGKTDSWRSVVTFTVKNAELEGPDEPSNNGNDNGLSSGTIAIIILAAIILIVILLIVIFIVLGARKEKKGTIPSIDHPKPKPKVAVEEEKEEESAAGQEPASDIYSPSGWGATPSSAETSAPSAPVDDSFMSFGADVDDSFMEKESAIFATDGPTLVDDIFDEPEKKKEKKRKPRKEVKIDIDLPEGALPDTAEEWEDVDEWDDPEDEEGEWEELDELDDEEDWDEMEEDEGEWDEMEEDEGEWEDVDEDDESWEEEEDVEEKIFVIECKCGEEIEIPSTFKGSKFRCPSCGRTGKLRK